MLKKKHFIDGYEKGYVIKLFSPKMSNIDDRDEKELHSKPFHRVWMLAEFDILSDEQLKIEQAKWDG